MYKLQFKGKINKGDGLGKAISMLPFELVEENPDFILEWGSMTPRESDVKRGICLANYMLPFYDYDIVFYETEVQKRFLEENGYKGRTMHAFGVNTDIFRKIDILPHPTGNFQLGYPKIWDYISVGAFNNYHRYEKLLTRKGFNLVIGGIMKENIQQSFNHIANAVLNHWMTSDEVNHETLAKLYNMSKKAYLPAEFGQERAMLEARACGLEVEIEPDNPKLAELLTSPIYDHNYYKKQLEEGILSIL